MSQEVKAKRIKFGIETDNDLILSTTNIPFGNKTGALLNIRGDMDITSFISQMPTVPGVMVIDILPSIGRNNRALNTYMGKLYATLVRKISGAKSIEKVDQFMYIEIGKTCVDMVCTLKTIYELAFIYKEYNLYWPKAMLKGLGVNPDSMAENLEDLRAWINRFISRIRSFNFPNLAYLKSGWEYGRTILLDSPDVTRSQAYMFHLRFCFEWDPISDPNGTLLRVTDLGDFSSNMSFSSLRGLYDSVVDSFAYDQDFIDISAWYSHLYESNPDGLLKFTDCTEKMEHVQLTYDPEALSVIENIEFTPSCNTYTGTYNIYQLNNEAQQNCAFDISAAGTTWEQSNIEYVRPHVCLAHKTKPTNKDVAKYCTFKYEYSTYLAGRDGTFPISAALFINNVNDYLAVQAIIVQINANGTFGNIDYKDAMLHPSNFMNVIPILSQFSHKPLCLLGDYIISSGQYNYISGSNYVKYTILTDLDNYVEITNEILKNYHQAVWFTNLEDK